ncbi:DHH family phosphoesterase [Candidatus Micrarchaeota archaeon]|nr:DHH family phosphoesterase [Candidatus Micrarchaeota archaeon]
MIVLEGVVSRVRFFRGKRDYVLTDGKIEHQFFTDEPVPQGACVVIEGEMAVGGVRTAKIDVLGGEREERALAKVKANVAAAANLPDAPALLRDGVVQSLWPALKNGALEIALAKKLGRSVMLRFHGDADGICGAFALTSVLPCKAFQQNSAIYSVKEALRDIAAIGQESRPLVILLDFGSADGCAEGLELLRAAGIDCIVIDHHPYSRKGDARIINPFSLDDNASKYTAGYLACEVAAACGLEKERALALARTACAGDKSDILQSGPEDMKKAMVLDFLASHVSFGNNLDFYKKVMEKDELFSSIAQQADDSIRDAAAKAMSRMKKTDAGPLSIAVFSLEGIVVKGEWPPSSKITTRVFDTLNGAAAGGGAEKPLFCIGYTERSVIMRLNGSAVSLGLSANDLAGRIRKSMADFVEGGGGHVKAGAVRAREGFAREVVNELIRDASIIAAGGSGKEQ